MRKTYTSFLACALTSVLLASCADDISYVQKESPANVHKDYEGASTGIVGIGTPVDQQQAKANATIRVVGQYALEDVMRQVADTYSLAIRWGESVRKRNRADMVINNLTFDEARNYIEDVFDVQIIREGDRRLLITPSIHTAKILEFLPGNNVSLGQVVRGLAEQCDMNLVITENRSKLANTRITTSFKNVNCMDAFDAVLAPQGLSLVDHGSHYSIGGFAQRQWVVNLYEPLRSEEQEISYSSGVEAEGEGGSISESGGKASTVTKGSRDLWKELETDLSNLVDKSCPEGEALTAPVLAEGGAESASFGTASSAGGGDCGYVRINRAVGLVQMRGPNRVLNEADDIIRRVEDIASRRLLVEARIMAVTRTRGFEQGSNFHAGKDGEFNLSSNPGSNVESTTATDSVTSKLLKLTSTGGFASYAGDNLEAAVKVLESYGTTYQLMQPTLEVMDRQRAILIDGRNKKYAERTATPREDSSGNALSPTIETEIKSQFIGIQFAVAAQIADPGEPHTVALQIPITDEDGEIVVEVPTNNDPLIDRIPQASTRLIDQKIRIRDGEIKVIGGLTKTIAVDKESGVPLLRGVPVAGKLFNEENIEYENVEFVVLLRVKRIY